MSGVQIAFESFKKVIMVQIENVTGLAALIVSNYVFSEFGPSFLEMFTFIPLPFKFAMLAGARAMSDNTIYEMLVSVPKLSATNL